MKQFLLFTLAAASFAASPVEPVNHDRSGIAIKGYDPVAYFKQSMPVKGKAELAFEWMGAKWLFVNNEDRNQFVSAPEKFAPQYGGYCAWAVSKGSTASIDPEVWKIIEGKLYLNYSKDIQHKWEKDVGQRIAEANRNWPGLHK